MASRTPCRDAAAVDGEAQALALRKDGHSYQQIAKIQNCSVACAWKRVQRSIERLREQVDEAAEHVRDIELARLDEAVLALMPRVRDGDDKAIASMIRAMERRAKMLGLDSPDKHRHEIDGFELDLRPVPNGEA
jgi:hypothetical protein